MQYSPHAMKANPVALIIALSVALSVCASAGHALPADNRVDLEQRVAELQAEVLELRQTVALLHGGAAVVPGQGQLATPVGQQFLPSTANTQRTLATRASFWPHYYTFQSAVTADNEVTATHVMTDRPAGGGGAWCVVLGDAAGHLYFFTPQGHLLFEHDIGVTSAATALASTLVRSNNSQLAVGLQDGTIHMLRIGHENLRAPDGRSIVTVSTVFALTAANRTAARPMQPAAKQKTPKGSHKAAAAAPVVAVASVESQSESQYESESEAQTESESKAQSDSDPEQQRIWPVRYLMFTKSQQRKVLISIDDGGGVDVLAQATGRLLLSRQLGAAPLAVHMQNDFQMTVQTPHAAVVVLLHMGRSNIVRHCAGLPHAPTAAAAVADRAAAAASTQAADLHSSTAASSISSSNSSSSSGDTSSPQGGSCQLETDRSGHDLTDPSSSSSSSSSSEGSVLPEAGSCQVTTDQISDPSSSSNGSSQQDWLEGTADTATDRADRPAAAAESNVLSAAAFDPVRSHRLFGVTAGGDLVTMLVPAAQRNFCKVIHRLPLGLPPGPVRLVASRGRLILLHAAGVAAFNISSSSGKLTGGQLVSHTWKDIWKLYGLDWQQQQRYPATQQQQGLAAQQQQQQWQWQQKDDLISDQNQVAGSRRLSGVDQDSPNPSSSSSSGGSSRGVLPTAAGDSPTPVLAGTAAAGLLLLPIGSNAIAMFSDHTGLQGYGSLSNTGSGSGLSTASDAQNPTDWIKLLQPFIVVMMVVVAVWQFLRASRGNAHMRQRRLDPMGIYGGSGSGFGSGLDGSGFEGLGPSDMGQIGMARDLFGNNGFSGLDRDFGEYAGPRRNRQNNRMTESILDSGYGGLNAATARRRARHVMQGKPDRDHQRGLGGGLRSGVQGQGSVARQSHGVAARQQQQQRGFTGPTAGVLRSPQGQQGSGLRLSPSGRRVTFEGLEDDSGSEIQPYDEREEQQGAAFNGSNLAESVGNSRADVPQAGDDTLEAEAPLAAEADGQLFAAHVGDSHGSDIAGDAVELEPPPAAAAGMHDGENGLQAQVEVNAAAVRQPIVEAGPTVLHDSYSTGVDAVSLDGGGGVSSLDSETASIKAIQGDSVDL